MLKNMKILFVFFTLAIISFSVASKGDSNAPVKPDDNNPGRHPQPGANMYQSIMDDMMWDMIRVDKTYDDSDIDFCAMMIPHHWGAIFMCEEHFKVGKSPLIREICEKIQWSQLHDINDFEAYLKKRGIDYVDPSINPIVDYIFKWKNIELDPSQYMAEGVVPNWVKVGKLLAKGIDSYEEFEAIKAKHKGLWTDIL